jgi:DNA-binding winged helix-turn-helix (wHTH) protein/Flp pilus assembly protein TadD
MHGPALPDVVRFGAFEIDREALQLTRSGRRVHLAPQALRLLLLLIDKQGSLVTRDEIRTALWSNDTFVDVDSAVNACVSQIRTVLGDKPTAPRFVETIPRKGYRFVAPVNGAPTQNTDHDPVLEPPGVETIPPSTNEAHRLRVALAAGLTLVVAGLVFVAMRSGSDAPRHTGAPAYAKTRSLQAIQLLEQGRSGLADASPAELQARVRYFESALELEPDFAEAYAGIADAKLILASYRTETPQTAYTAAKAAAAKALALNDSLPDAHATYAAAVLFYEWDWSSSREHLSRAAAHGVTARVHHWYARALTAAGRHQEALAHTEKAVRMEPTSPSALTYHGVAAFYAGQAVKAEQLCRRALEMMPEFTPARFCLDAAADPVRGAGPATPDVDLAPAVRLTSQAEPEKALDWLQSAANHHTDALVFAAVHPGLATLRHEVRFASVLTRVGLPASSAQARR